jgi:transposase
MIRGGEVMGSAVILRTDYTAEQLRKLAVQTKDANQARRLLAIAAVLEGRSRAEAAKIDGMDRQTLRDWVHRFNADGPDALCNRKAPGAPPKLSAEQKEELKAIVAGSPDPIKDGVVRWRCCELKIIIAQRFGVHLSEATVGRILKELGFAHVSPRPQHPKQDQQAIETFKKTFPPPWLRSAPARTSPPKPRLRYGSRMR